MLTSIKDQINESIQVKQLLLESKPVLNNIEKATETIISAFRDNKKVLLAGNGGSAADAQHIAAEFVNRFYFDRPGLPSVALTTDTSVLTAIGNDCGFDYVFARQLKTLGNAGDVFIGISTSGNSKNVIEALKVCREAGINSVVLTGASGRKMKENSDICIEVPSNVTPRIQEVHILIGHIICNIVENELFGKLKPAK